MPTALPISRKRVLPSSSGVPEPKKQRNAVTTSKAITKETSELNAAAVADAIKKEGTALLKQKASLETIVAEAQAEQQSVASQLVQTKEGSEATRSQLEAAQSKQIILEGDRDRLRTEQEQRSVTTSQLQDTLQQTTS